MSLRLEARAPALAAALLLLAAALASAFAPWLAPHDPGRIDLAQQLAGPSWEHPLGRDHNGADLFSRLLYGGRLSLGTALLVTLLSTGIGTALGLLAGYRGGWTDRLLLLVVDILLAFPGLLLAIALVAVLGPHPGHVVIALSAMGWVSFARLVRGQVLSLKERPFLLAARALGAPEHRILLNHLLPNLLAPVVVQATFGLAGVVIAESSLHFLGLGAPPGTPSWGGMLSEGTRVLLEAPHVAMVPGLAILLVVMAFNLLGDSLEARLDPRRSGRP